LLLIATLGGTGSASAAAPRAALVHERLVPNDASPDVRQLAAWILAHHDNQGLPIVIVDKTGAKAFAMDPNGGLVGAAPVLLGLARGDDSPPGIGDRKLASITPQERITPAGRFAAALGRNIRGKEVLWVDYSAAISLHPVITTNPAEHRLERLATPSPADNRISYGCINVPAAFFESVVRPLFSAKGGMVYVLPEVRSTASVFFGDGPPRPQKQRRYARLDG
jgi:hypothetical protein